MSLLKSIKGLDAAKLAGIKAESFVEAYKSVQDLGEVDATTFGLALTSFSNGSKGAFFIPSIVVTDEDRAAFGLPADATHLPCRAKAGKGFVASDFQMKDEVISYGKETGHNFAEPINAKLEIVEAIEDVWYDTSKLDAMGEPIRKMKNKKGERIFQFTLIG